MIPVSGDNNGCFPRPRHCRGALASSAYHRPTTDHIPTTEHQNANIPARDDTNHDASNSSGLNGATAVNKV